MRDSKVRVAVLVSGGGTNLQAILDYIEAGKMPDGEICAVVSDNADAYALERAKKHNIPALTLLRKDCDSKEDYENKLLALLRDHGTEVVVLAGFMRILSGEFVSNFEDRMINVHPSLIPSFCGKGFYGLHVHEKALEYGVKVTGATVHFVNSIPDGGQIIAQKAVRVHKNDTPETLQRRVMEQAEWKIFPKAVSDLCRKIRKGKK
ncbi:MAG: phosphoribosylglycinamide formyltransferase [Clostridia bacterium]|nr:phosphoribosylglycinamide formyltransferase [Clostridia bacterium]MBR2472570.1 phosphoribosylglycinamide formyltransferase [Clostridia bacterium]MBR3865612.1 phosphoribosylglycinamide formyltransferase [Clostridia bacterium]